MALLIGSFVSGLIFGIGLLISGMVHPAKVIGFLDIFGAWDPSLAVVMAAALTVTGIGYVVAQRRKIPLFAGQSFWPPHTAIDGKLAAGAAIFGIGWGLSGLCPGPALENLVTLSPKLLAFVAAMMAGMILRDYQHRMNFARAAAEPMTAGDG